MTCSKCGNNESRDGQRWCKACKARYERENRPKRDESQKIKAYLKGFNDLRADLSSTFLRIGKGEMTGYTAAEIVRNSKANVSRETSTGN